MKTIKKTSFFLKSTIVVVAALASVKSKAQEGGHGSGNGGNAIVCFNNPKIPRSILSQEPANRVIPNSALSAITFIEALDLFEARHSAGNLEGRNVKVDLFQPTPGETNEAFVERIAERLDGKIPTLAYYIREAVNEFKGKVISTSESSAAIGVAQVYDVGRLGYSIDPTRCVLSTVMNQSGFDENLNLTIDSRLLNHPKNGELSRKTLTLHEMVYLWGRKSGQEDSERTRKVIGLLIRKQFSRNEMLAQLKGFQFDRFYQPLYFEDNYDYHSRIIEKVKETQLAALKAFSNKGLNSERKYYEMLLSIGTGDFDKYLKDHERPWSLDWRGQTYNCSTLQMSYSTIDQVPPKLRLGYRICAAHSKKDADLKANRDAIIKERDEKLTKMEAKVKAMLPDLYQWLDHHLIAEFNASTGGTCYSNLQVFRDSINKLVDSMLSDLDEYHIFLDFNLDLPHCDDFKI